MRWPPELHGTPATGGVVFAVHRHRRRAGGAPSIMAELTRWQGLLTRSAPITDAATLGVQADLAKEVITLDAEQTRAYLTSGSVTAALIADTGTAITRWLLTGEPQLKPGHS